MASLAFSEIIIISILDLLSIIVYLHAKRRGLRRLALLWALAVIFLGPFGVTAYMVYNSYIAPERRFT